MCSLIAFCGVWYICMLVLVHQVIIAIGWQPSVPSTKKSILTCSIPFILYKLHILSVIFKKCISGEAQTETLLDLVVSSTVHVQLSAI